MVVPTEVPNPNNISQTDVDVLANLLREYEPELAELPEQQKLTKLCSDAGFLNNIGKAQCFITLDEDGPDDLKTSCQMKKHPERGWFRGNTNKYASCKYHT